MRGRERWRRDFVMTSDGERTRENGKGNMASGNVRTCTVTKGDKTTGEESEEA